MKKGVLDNVNRRIDFLNRPDDRDDRQDDDRPSESMEALMRAVSAGDARSGVQSLVAVDAMYSAADAVLRERGNYFPTVQDRGTVVREAERLNRRA